METQAFRTSSVRRGHELRPPPPPRGHLARCRPGGGAARFALTIGNEPFYHAALGESIRLTSLSFLARGSAVLSEDCSNPPSP